MVQISSTIKPKILPLWLLNMLGITFIAATVIRFTLYWFKNHSPHRSISNEVAVEESWGQKVLSNLKGNKKRMTISLKNTVLWNPSPDMNTLMYGFKENTVELLARLSYMYDMCMIVQVNSEGEREEIQSLMNNAFLLKKLAAHHKVMFCSSREGKIHFIKHIEPHIHIEGGSEKDDGKNTINELRPFVKKLIWVTTNKTKVSLSLEYTNKEDRLLVSRPIEISDSLINTTVANGVK